MFSGITCHVVSPGQQFHCLFKISNKCVHDIVAVSLWQVGIAQVGHSRLCLERHIAEEFHEVEINHCSQSERLAEITFHGFLVGATRCQ